ncbi:17466_t:CDS:2, partial [Racocetra persica]
TSSEFLTTLSNDLSWLLENAENCDVVLQAGQEPNVRKFHAHIAILRARSNYFKRALAKQWVKHEEDGLSIFQKPNIYPEVFEEILKYIYKGKIELGGQDGQNLLNLLTAGDELMLDEFCNYIQNFLIQQKFEWLEENLVEILPVDLNEDIVKYHFKPGSIPRSIVLPPRDQGMNLDSFIIKPIHARLICGWIDGKNILGPTYVKAAYDFKLLVRGTHDGFDATTFHSRCDRKGPTVVVLKLEGVDEILGGYNAAYWRTGAVYIQSDKSFIFSLGDGKNLQEVKLSRVRDSATSMYGHTSYGPHFGTADLRMYSPFNIKENCSCQHASYYRTITEHVRFAAEEYEVFQ